MLTKQNAPFRAKWQTTAMLVLALLLGSCSTATVTPISLEPIQQPTLPTQPPPTPQPLTATPSAPEALYEVQLKNATYLAPQSGQTVTLVDGKYEGGSGATYLSLALLPQMAFGDLNGDGGGDAAALLAENTGGSGTFVSLVALLNQDGQAVQAGASFVDDRPQIDSLEIQDGQIILQAIVHQPTDPMTSPSLQVTNTYRLQGMVLKLEQQATATEIAGQEPPTLPVGEPITLSLPVMLDENTGWAMAYEGGILRTTDGGQSWTNVMPVSQPSNTFFLDAQTAWAYTSGESSSSLVRTLDGGGTWSSMSDALPFYGYVTLKFENENDGWAETYDAGAGNAYISLYQTHDGGANWTQVMLTTPDDPLREPGVLHLCNICGDYFYFDAQRMLIIYGELANEPTGELKLALSTDEGKTWQAQTLPFPSEQYAQGMVSPQSPVFFNENDGLLPFGLISYDADEMDISTIYTTQDGGQSWKTSTGVVVDSGAMSGRVQVVTLQDAFAPCGQDLCVTHDGGQSWQALGSNLSFAYTSETEPYVWQFGFIDAQNGWAVSELGLKHGLWRTTDGGVTWEELMPMLATNR